MCTVLPRHSPPPIEAVKLASPPTPRCGGSAPFLSRSRIPARPSSLAQSPPRPYYWKTETAIARLASLCVGSPGTHTKAFGEIYRFRGSRWLVDVPQLNTPKLAYISVVRTPGPFSNLSMISPALIDDKCRGSARIESRDDLPVVPNKL